MKRMEIDLPFEFTDGSCKTLDAMNGHPSRIYLCFGSGDYNVGHTPKSMENGCYYKNAIDV